MSHASEYAENMERLWERVLEIALDEVGPKELAGKNRGECEKYLRPLGLPPGSPYCVAGIRWAFGEACKELNLPNPMAKTGGVIKLWNATPTWMRATRISVGPAIFCHQSATKPGTGHVGIVTRIRDTGVIETLEFNTDGGGSRDGDGVYLRTRPPGYVNLGYIDPCGFRPEDRVCRS